MHCLITGGLGFIGTNFIRYLLNKNQDIKVTNIDKLSYGANPNNLKEFESLKNYKFVKGDICNKELVKKSLEKQGRALIQTITIKDDIFSKSQTLLEDIK